jgi:hypothetical protein
MHNSISEKSANPSVKGNRCGHNTESPKIYQSPPRIKKRPSLLTRAKYRANNVALGRSWDNPQYLRNYKEQRQLDISYRKMRSEGRSRFAQFSGVVFDHIDLETMQVGHWSVRTGLFVPYSWVEISGVLDESQSKGAGENFSRSRMYDEIDIWQSVGYLRNQERVYKAGEDQNGKTKFRQDVSHKWICKRLFLELGLTEKEIEEARQESKKRNDITRMNAAVSLCANNPQAKAADAIVLMQLSARNGARSKIRQYYDRKKAEQAIKDVERAQEAKETNTPTNAPTHEKKAARACRVAMLIKSTGMTKTEAEKLIPIPK